MADRELSPEMCVLLIAVRRALLALVGALEAYLAARGIKVLFTRAARQAARKKGEIT